MADRPWPLNGEVINESSVAIEIYDYDNRERCSLPGGCCSEWKGQDVDLVCDQQGRWFKVGANKVTVDQDGKVKFTRFFRRMLAIFPFFKMRELAVEKLPKDLRTPPAG